MQGIPLSISIHKIHEKYMEKIYLLLQEEREEIDKLILSTAPIPTSLPTPMPTSLPTSLPTPTTSLCLYVNDFTIKSYTIYIRSIVK